MRTLVFGSLNIDRTYTMTSIVKEGETVSASNLQLFCGGKGLNQAVALARAGTDVSFAGAVGEDGGMLLEMLAENHIGAEHVLTLPGASGHAVIQVDEAGRNCIIILAGTNGQITEEHIRNTLADFAAGDLLVLQNEINNLPLLMKLAHEKGMKIAFNPSPMNAGALACDLKLVDYLFVNETEGASLSGKQEPSEIVEALLENNPSLHIILTLGSKGSVYADRENVVTCGIYKVNAVDTTAAGDTFTGYFLHSLMVGEKPEDALWQAAVASGISVTRKGAVPSIPTAYEVRRVASGK